MAVSIVDFGALKTSYSVELPAGTTVVPTVAATPTDTNASAVVTAATSLPGTTTVVITAQDGVTTRYGFDCLDIGFNTS